MPNVLRAQKRAGSERLKKHAWLNQTRDGLQTEATDGLDFLVYFAQLRNAIGRESQLPHARQIFRTGMSLMRGLERLPNRAPNLMLLR